MGRAGHKKLISKFGIGADYSQIEEAAQEIVSGLEKEDEAAERGTPQEAARRARLEPPRPKQEKKKVTPKP